LRPDRTIVRGRTAWISQCEGNSQLFANIPSCDQGVVLVETAQLFAFNQLGPGVNRTYAAK